MAEDALHATPVMTSDEVQADQQMPDVSQPFGAIAVDHEDLLRLLEGTSKVDQNVNCLGQEGTSHISTPTTGICNGGAPVDNVKSPGGQDSSKQKQELASGEKQTTDSSKQKLELTSLDKQTKSSESLISCDEEVQEQVTVETEKLSDVNSKKDHKLGCSIRSEMSEQSKVVKDNESLVASELSPETNDGYKKQLSETGNITVEISSKPTDTKPADKEDATSDKDTDEDISLKEMLSPIRIDKSKGQQEYGGASSKRKRLQEAQETPLSKKNKMLDENLVGSRIKVWWPYDKMFYAGVIEAFDSSSKKHKVLYDDGDVEVLVLKKERWEFIAEEQETDPDAPSNIPRSRKAKGSSGQQKKGGKTGTPQSGSDVKVPPKKRGHPKGVRSSNIMSNADTSVTPARLKGKSAEKDSQETHKTGINSKKEGARPSRSTRKAKDAVVKASSKDEADSTDNSKDDAGSEDKN